MAKRDFWRTSAWRTGAATSALLAGLLVGHGPVLADFDDGVAAYDAGDYAEAMAQWRPLAEAGNADAQYWLGRLFERGEGVPASLARAAMWYRLAAGQENTEAQTALDGVLETLRARETGVGPAQLADTGSADGAAAPGFEPDRDLAYAPPAQEPGRTADVTQPAGLPARDGQPSTGAADVDVALADSDETAAGGADAPAGDDALAAGDGAADEPGTGPGDGSGQGTAVADGADGADAVDADAVADADAAEQLDPGALAADATDVDALEAEVADAEALEADALEAAVLEDELAEAADPVEDGAAADELADIALAEDAAVEDEAIGDLAALDEDALAEDSLVAEDSLAAEDLGEMPLPPELTEALADGALDADEIAALVEDGVLSEEMVDDLIEAGVLDEAALVELAEAGVLDEAAIDALVDSGLVDEAMVDDARAALADGGEVVADGDSASVIDTIGDGVARLFGQDAPAAEPERRLITARQ